MEPHHQSQSAQPRGNRIFLGGDCLPDTAVRSVEISERLEGRAVRTTITAIVQPAEVAGLRWDYKSEAKVFRNGELIFTGNCAYAEFQADGSLKLTFEGAIAELERTIIKSLALFGMTGKERIYYLALLAGARGANVEGFSPDPDLRPFLYAVPIEGLKADKGIQSLSVNDLGVAAGEADTTFHPIIEQLGLDTREPLWKRQVPKAFGVVFASDLLEAERLAWRRAAFTVGLISFSLRAGVSHLEDRLGSESLAWDADMTRSRVSLASWILIREVKTTKGWVREVPWLESRSDPDLDDIFARLKEFIDRLLRASMVGDVLDQTGRRNVSEREHRLITSIQRALHWYGVASTEDQITDRFLALWIALEAILQGIKCPQMFGGMRREVKNHVQEQIRKAPYSIADDTMFSLSADLLEARLNRDEWPLPRRLEMFARSLAIELKPEDSSLVRELGAQRGRILHAGDENITLTLEQVRQLEYLIERLIISAGVCAYADLEEKEMTILKIGTIPPQGGAAPLFIDGQEVDYTFHAYRDEAGELRGEYLVDGKVFNDRNSRLEPM